MKIDEENEPDKMEMKCLDFKKNNFEIHIE